MKHTTHTKQLLQEQKNALRALHDILHFDFEKPHTVHYIKGSYTAKKVLALASDTGYYEPLIAVLTKNKNNYWKDLHLVTIDKYGRIEIDYPAKNYRGNSRIDYFFRKGDFEDIRKKQTQKPILLYNPRLISLHPPRKRSTVIKGIYTFRHPMSEPGMDTATHI